MGTQSTWGSDRLSVAEKALPCTGLKLSTKHTRTMANFGDLKSDRGVKILNEYLEGKSYIDGFVPSQADVSVFEAMGKAPSASFAHALRWYNQISSYGSEKAKFPGVKKPVAAAPAPAQEDDDDDDVDLFGSDDEDDAEAERIKAERVAAYNERKAAKEAKKGVLIAKSNIILDVKPWDDETDMGALEAEVRKIETDGLLWGAAKLVPVGYGIKKLQICCVVEDDKVGTDFLEENICDLEDYVQSVDVAAFNKI